MKNSIYKSLALYNSQKIEIDYQFLLNSIIVFLSKYDIIPNFIGITGKGYPKSIIEYNKGLKKLEVKKFSGIESINIIYNTPYSDAPAYDWLLSIIINNYDSLEFFIGFDSGKFNLKTKDILVYFESLIKVEYGYTFYREFNKSPEFYAFGILSDNLNEDEENVISSWFRDSLSDKSYQNGKMRDLYPLNIINQKQLEYPISSTLKLIDFIHLKGTENSSLLKVCDNLFLWEIKKEKLIEYRNELATSQIFICYNKNVSPTLI